MNFYQVSNMPLFILTIFTKCPLFMCNFLLYFVLPLAGLLSFLVTLSSVIVLGVFLGPTVFVLVWFNSSIFSESHEPCNLV